MDLGAAIDSHTQWRVKLKAAISRGDTLDSSSIALDTRCELGQWLSGEGRARFGAKPEFQKLVSAHRAFHAAAGQVAAAVNAGKPVDAEKLLSGPFQAQSQETVAAIAAARKLCG